MSLDSSYAYVQQIERFVDLVDEDWVADVLPAETLFPNVSEFDEDDDFDALVGNIVSCCVCLAVKMQCFGFAVIMFTLVVCNCLRASLI